jgi:hypothetical protein
LLSITKLEPQGEKLMSCCHSIAFSGYNLLQLRALAMMLAVDLLSYLMSFARNSFSERKVNVITEKPIHHGVELDYL